MSITRTIAKNTLFGFVEVGTDLISGFVLGIVVARGLGAEQYGIYSYLLWLLGLAAILTDLGLSEMVKRFIAEAAGRGNRHQAIGLVRLTLGLRGAGVIIVALGFILTEIYWTGVAASVDNKLYLLIIALTILPHGMNYAFISIFRGFQRYEYASYVILGTSPLRLILIVALLFLGYGLREVLIVQIGTFSLGIFIGIYFLRRIIPLKELLTRTPFLVESALMKQVLRYALTLAGIGFVGYLAFNQLSTLFIERYCPVEQVGFFRLATKLVSMPMQLLPTAFSFVLTPAIAEQFGKGDMEKIKTIYITSVRYMMMFALPVEVGMIALASPIVRLFYGAEFIPVILLMQIMLIPSVMRPLSQVALAVFYGTNRPGFIFTLNGVFACISIGLSLWLIPRYGALGAAIICALPIHFALMIHFASKKIGASWPVRDTIKIVMASLVMGLAVFALQSQLGVIPSLALGIPSGVAIYFAAIFLLGVVRKEDLTTLKHVQGCLPKPMRKPYIRFSGLVEKILTRTKLAIGQ